AALFCAPDALAVDDRRRRARLAFGQFAAFHVKRMVDAIERAVVIPADEVIMYGAAWRKVLGDRAPLASGAQDVHRAVHHFTHLDRALVAAGLGPRDQRLDQVPFVIGQVTRVAQPATVV